MFAYSSRAALVGVFVVGLAALSFAACPPAACPNACGGKMRTVTYPIADLMWKADGALPAHAEIMQVIASTVCPESWADRGGVGTVSYQQSTMALVVNQTTDVHEQVQDLLATMRRQMDVQVAIEIRFITTSTELVESLGLEKPSEAGEPAVSFLDDTQCRVLMTKVQEDKTTNVMQAPKMTTFDGQAAKLEVMENQSFVTGMDLQMVDGRKALLPRVQNLSSGVRIGALPSVSADRRSVKVHLGVEMSHIDPRVPTYPVSCVLGAANGKEGNVKPIIITQHIQRPHRSVIRIEKSMVIPDGGTAVLTSWKMEREVREEIHTPVLGEIPYINRLFTNVGYSKRSEHLLVLVTPHIIVPQEREEKLAVAPREEADGEEASEPVAEKTPSPLPLPKAASQPLAEKLPSLPIPRLYVKEKKFRLTYEVDNVGTSAVKQVEVWWTKDGCPWEKFCDDVKPTGKVVLSVKDDGVFGFRLIPRSGAGRAAPAPQGLDEPHTWVVVDTTPPAVKMEPVKVVDTNGGEVVLQWCITDAHLDPHPVTIRYAEKPEGPWKEILAKGAVAGVYRHPIKTLPTVAYFRIDAKDKSGNVGTAWTTEPIQIDLKVPMIKNVVGKPVP